VIFRRNKKRSDEQELDATSEPATDDLEGDAAASDEPPTADTEAGSDLDPLDLEALDAGDWRGQGPFDIAEIDEDDDLNGTPEMPRIDLGAMVLAGFPGAELRLQMSEETQQIVSAMLIHGDSALELGAYAAPRSGGLWSELRAEIMAAATEAGGTASLAEGPFGVELRRLIPVSTPEGEQGYQPSRMWVAEGPRWLLRGIVYGQAALEDDLEGAAGEMLAAFRSVIVRRGEEAMAPGDLLSLTMPPNLVPTDEGQA
jgi:hypothetical protein